MRPPSSPVTLTAVYHLRQDEESWQQAGLNSWQTACYGALAASDWLCAGGFRF
jgi:hypothetical protein